ncbi:MAG: DUF4861 domain-containing protein [Tannerella sp.]|jgi:hypothetical protein|nr:DUF4861 domain-containing protein [Tannerella sp.]
MNKLLIFCTVALTAFLQSCVSGVEISVTNPSAFERSEMVELTADSLMKLPAGKAFIVKNSQGEKIPSQLTYNGKLIFQTELKPGESKNYKIFADDPETYPAKTYGRFIKERKEDFAWENDRVAFRIYGHELIQTDGPSNGIDLWYKRTSDLIIDKWYNAELENGISYHEDHGEGMDAYSVGRSLGGGAMAPYINDSLILNENYVRHEVLENGPLRTTFRLYYNDLVIDSVPVSETRTISLDAGSQFTKITQEYGVDKVITVAAGIVKHPGSPDALAARTESGVAAIVCEEPVTPATGMVYVGLVFPSGIEKDITKSYTIFHPKKKVWETHSHVLGVTTYQPGRPITYYAGFGWEKWGFPTLTDFQTYIGYFSKALEEPLIIKKL